MYIIKRPAGPSQKWGYVTRPGSLHSYSQRLESARVYPTRTSAHADACDNEIVPVCTAYWTEADWAKLARRHVEPLVLQAELDTQGRPWTATGERNQKGALLYAPAASA